jgi:hypothetical protein
MSAEISASGAQMIFETLHHNAIPVVVFYRRDGLKVMNHGVLAEISDEHGLLIAPKSSEPLMDYLAVSLGIPKGVGCKFEYADKWSEPADRANIDERLGEAILLISLPDGGELRLHIPSGVVSPPSS